MWYVNLHSLDLTGLTVPFEDKSKAEEFAKEALQAMRDNGPLEIVYSDPNETYYMNGLYLTMVHISEESIFGDEDDYDDYDDDDSEEYLA